ncbi:MAG: malonyl-ACP O-methyltransferase BioC [Candidatus Contendobacter sp.]|nr:malonyl-ACP O-methyltransferase BioC [Candidatus Contendobacter sp.]MDS4059505.1 malonyl-ACP O-methyltransferase BioC [Candidatus Contendobacter sp.]
MTAPITVTDPPPALPAKQRIRQAFDHAATGYDAAADVQREMADRLAACLLQADVEGEPAAVLDAGCGTGYSAAWLAQRWPRAELTLLDFAPAMLAMARTRHPGARVICADIEALPFGDDGFGGYWSSLTWQWNDPRRCLAEAARVLEPEGWLAVATLGADNFPELRHAFAGVDGYSHVLAVPPPEQLLAECRAAGWSVRVWERRPVRRHFPDARRALRSVKAVGAREVEQRRPTPLSRGAWQAINARYEQLREDAGLPLTYDGVWLIATRP